MEEYLANYPVRLHPNSSYSLAEITTRWVRFYSEIAPSVCIDWDLVVCEVKNNISNGQLSELRPNLITGESLVLYEKIIFGININLVYITSPFFSLEDSNKFFTLDSIVRDAKAMELNETQFAIALLNLELPLYVKLVAKWCVLSTAELFDIQEHLNTVWEDEFVIPWNSDDPNYFYLNGFYLFDYYGLKSKDIMSLLAPASWDEKEQAGVFGKIFGLPVRNKEGIVYRVIMSFDKNIYLRDDDIRILQKKLNVRLIASQRAENPNHIINEILNCSQTNTLKIPHSKRKLPLNESINYLLEYYPILPDDLTRFLMSGGSSVGLKLINFGKEKKWITIDCERAGKTHWVVKINIPTLEPVETTWNTFSTSVSKKLRSITEHSI